MKTIDDFLLSDKFTVRQAKQWIKDKDDSAKSSLAELIHDRFYNRYVKHLKIIDSGFLRWRFRQGEKNTKGKGIGKKMFKDFFIAEEGLFPGFKEIASDFYSSIRCGILHQAETINAWRILRGGILLDKAGRTINATKFVNALEKSLDSYVSTLRASDFTTTLWKNAILKIEDVCGNCNVSR